MIAVVKIVVSVEQVCLLQLLLEFVEVSTGVVSVVTREQMRLRLRLLF